MENICVAVRMRPPAPEETPGGGGTQWRWKVEDNRVSLHKPLGTPISSNLSFAFDHVFDESCSNATVYELLTKDIIYAAVEGFNGTAFAYGQTSSGKTFTMNGSQTDPGIIHRAVRDVFNKIEMICDREFLIRVSYMEIYNEEINDLLAVENQKLQIHESLERGIFVAGLREEIVSNAEQVFHILQLGEVNRHFGQTNMNTRSSRSHTIFRMVIESKGKDTNYFGDYSSDDAVRVSVLNLVDLAGSERIAKTGAGGVRVKEGKYINKSLMVLGNVINKLSEGAKQGGHIPYRDSKLTRILQPALGGNAKTSIICTIAPEEVHIEETKGTLQFASRAKRITNCAHVNEILTDAALLKRQKLEIEELRKELQGSRAEVLEQEVLKLRNEMLQYEQEREKLETELEEERRSHKERDQCIREQQMKIDNLSSLVTFSDSDRKTSQNSGRQNLKGEFNDSSGICQEDIFESPRFKPASNAFVVKRSNYSRMPDYSPIPDSFSNIADEDTWLKMNKGFIADLDSLQVTPVRKMQSFPSGNMTTDYSSGNYGKEIQNLKREIEIVTEEKHEIQKKNSELLLLNDRLMEKIAKLEREALLVREIPGRVCQSIGKCKDVYKDVLLTLQRSIPDGESSAATLLSGTSEISISLLSSLETHLSAAAVYSENYVPWNTSLVQEQCKVLSERLKGTIRSLVSSETLTRQSKEARNQTCSCDHKDCTVGGDTISCNKENLNNKLSSFKDQCNGLEKKLDHSNQLLEVSREKYSSLEKDFQLLRKERDTLLETVSESSEELALVTDQKQIVQKDLLAEAHRRKCLEEEIKRFNIALANRQRSVTTFHSELKATIEKLTGKNPVMLSKPLGY